MLKISIFCVLLALSNTITMFNQVELTTKNGAMCMDGSPYSIYTYVPDPLDFDTIANKVLIFWQQIDFGWCFRDNTTSTLQQCHKFLVEDNLIDDASSLNWPGSQFFLTGILSLFEGGYFTNWPKVLIKSCDGGSYMGNSAPISFRSKKIHFRGTQNILEAVNYLNKINFLKNREEVVMVGSFNAAIGALAWADYFKAQTNGKFRVIADAALFLNAYSYKHNSSYIQNRMRMVQKFTLQNASFPNAACAEAHKGQLWKCLFLDELITFVKHPVYLLQSLYDGWDITQVLGFACVQQFGSLSQCKEWQRQIVIDYHKNVSIALDKILSLHPEHGAFAIACVGHQFMGGKYNNPWYQVPQGSGIRPINVTSKWAKGLSRQVHIDPVEWPNNKICARKASPAPTHLKYQ